MVSRGRGNNIKIPPGRYTASQVANKVGVSLDTVKRWHREGYLPQIEYMVAGELRIPLFNSKSVRRACELAKGTGKLDARLKKSAA